MRRHCFVTNLAEVINEIKMKSSNQATEYAEDNTIDPNTMSNSKKYLSLV
jgi:hypothetical protein